MNRYFEKGEVIYKTEIFDAPLVCTEDVKSRGDFEGCNILRQGLGPIDQSRRSVALPDASTASFIEYWLVLWLWL